MAFVASEFIAVNQTTAGFQTVLDLRVTPSGGFEVDWVTDGSAPDGGETLTPAQRSFDPAGAPVTAEISGSTSPGHLTTADNHLQQTLQLEDGTVLKLMTVMGGNSPAIQLVLQQFDQSGAPLGNPILSTGFTRGGLVQLPDRDIVMVAQPINKTGPGEIFATVVHNTSPAPTPNQPTNGDDHLTGTSGNDRLDGLRGNDVLDGGDGTDTAVVETSLSSLLSYSIGNGEATLTTDLGTLTLQHIERVQFGDALFALDTHPGEHTWQAAALLHAGFGVLPGIRDLSHWVAQADASGSMGELAQKMIDAYAPDVSSPDLVAYLYQQLTHQAPTADVVQSYVDQIGVGKTFATHGEALAFAASLSLNTDALAAIVGSVQQLDPAAL